MPFVRIIFLTSHDTNTPVFIVDHGGLSYIITYNMPSLGNEGTTSYFASRLYEMGTFRDVMY